MVLGSLVSSTARRRARPWPSTHASRDSLHPFADHRLAEGKGLSIIGQRQEAKLFDLAAEITYDKMTDAQDSSGTQTRDELSPLRHGVSVQNGSLLRNMGYACPSAERLRRARVFSGGTQSCVARSSTSCLGSRDRLGGFRAKFRRAGSRRPGYRCVSFVSFRKSAAGQIRKVTTRPRRLSPGPILILDSHFFDRCRRLVLGENPQLELRPPGSRAGIFHRGPAAAGWCPCD